MEAPPIHTVLAPWQPDVAVVYALAGVVRYGTAEAALRACGPEVLPDPAACSLARVILSDDNSPRTALTARERARFDELAAAVRRTVDREIIPATEVEAVGFVRLLADRAHRPMLASDLDWAASRIREGWPIERVRRELNVAFLIALGETSLESVLGERGAA